MTAPSFKHPNTSHLICFLFLGLFHASLTQANEAMTIFEDNFDASGTTIVANDISDPSGRGNGSAQAGVKYKLRGNIVVSDGTKKNSGAGEEDPNVPNGSIVDSALRIHNNALDFSAGLTVHSSGHITAPDTSAPGTSGAGSPGPFTRDIGFVDNSDNEFDWSTVLGDHYEISFKLHATYNSPLAFSISDTVTAGRYNPHMYVPTNGSDPPYDFGMNTWVGKWNLGEDGNAQDNDPSEVGTQGFGVATAGTSYHVRVLIDERNPQATASVFIDGNASALHTFDIDFENTERYFQFNGRTGYGGTLDDLQINSYAVPEPSNSTLLLLLLTTGMYAFKRQFIRD